MPATNPRISVTVQPSIDALLTRLSELTGQSKSAFVADLLENSMPILERMVIVIDAAKQAQVSLKDQSLKDMEEAEAKLHEVLGVTMDIFDEGTASILKESERIQRRKSSAAGADDVPSRARRRAAAASQPPYVTRGSGTPTDKKINKNATFKEVIKRASKTSKGKGKG